MMTVMETRTATVERRKDRHSENATLVRLDPELRTALKRRAEAEERTLSAVIRRALRRYLEDTAGDGDSTD